VTKPVYLLRIYVPQQKKARRENIPPRPRLNITTKQALDCGGEMHPLSAWG